MLTIILTGISLAAIYAIAASGLVVTYTTTGTFNFAHGAIGMLAAYLYRQATASTDFGGWGWPVWLGLIFVVLFAAPAFGVVVERGVMRRLDGASEVVKVVVTVSLLLALVGLAVWQWPSVSSDPEKFLVGTSWEKFRFGDTTVTGHQIVTVCVALAVAIGLRLLLFRTRLGVAMRAVVDDRNLVRLNGAKPHRLAMFSWALGFSLAAVSGVLVAPERGLNQVQLTLLVVNAYAAAVVGRLRSLPMTFVGALVLGIGQSLAATKLIGVNIGWFSLADLQYAVSPVLLFFAMLFLPSERLRAGAAKRVRESWRLPSLRTAAWGALGFVVAVVAATDLIGADPDRAGLVTALSFALVALSLVPLTGMAGQISLAQMSFFGVGALIMSWIGDDGHTVAGLIVAIAVSAVVGGLVALPALRLTGLYLALGTAAFSLFMTRMVFKQTRLMPGDQVAVPGLDLGFATFRTNQAQITLLAIVFAAVGVFVIWLRGSSFGRRLTAMKDSPVACATLGLDLTRTKIAVFALSAAIAGLSGALVNRSVANSDFELLASMNVTMLAVVGGVGAVSGVLFGGLLLGVINKLGDVLFASNAVGIFGFVKIAVVDLQKVAPGFIGIGLGANPSGAATDIADTYRPVAESRPALSLAVGGPALAWVLARSGTINKWTFVAVLAVMVFGVIPAVPILLRPIQGGRASAAGAFAIASIVVTGAIDWETLTASNGMRVLWMLIACGAVARGVMVIHGQFPHRGPAPQPSPDLVGIDRPLDRSDAIEAERVLGLTEGVLRGAP